MRPKNQQSEVLGVAWRPTTQDLQSAEEATQLLSALLSRSPSTGHLLRDCFHFKRCSSCTDRLRDISELGGSLRLIILPATTISHRQAMAIATATAVRALPSSPLVADVKFSSRTLAATVNPCSISLALLPSLLLDYSPVRHSQGSQSLKFVFYCRKTAPNVIAMATGETPAEVATELPEFVTTLQEAWDRLDDKYAVTSLAIASLIALYGSVGLISAIDRLPVVPGLFELVGIGYSGWFVYRNLVFKPDRVALVAKLKDIYNDVLGSSS